MCDTLVTLTDEGVLFAKNSDRDPNEAQLVQWHPAGRGSGPLAVERADGVLISRPWWLWGAEMGTNEHGVTIGNEAVFTRNVAPAGGELTGMDLLRAALERASDRFVAVDTIVSLLEEHGQGGRASHDHKGFRYDNSFIVADGDGAIVLETAGRQHATEEVTGARSISNGLTIAGFAEKHADRLRGRVAECAARRARTTATARTATSLTDLMHGLRDHGESGRVAYRLANGALSAPCAHAGGLLTSTQTTGSWVANVTTRRHFVTATSAPCTSLFKPTPLGPLPLVEPTEEASDVADERFLWWRHERVHRSWVRDPLRYSRLAAERDELERLWVRDETPPEVAWAQAADWETACLAEHPTRDERPVLVRRLWGRWDAAAGMSIGMSPDAATGVAS